MSITANLNVKGGFNFIEGEILKALRPPLTNVLMKAAPPIKSRLREVCTNLIKGTEEYKSLINGELLAELGIPGVGERLNQILATISKSVFIEVNPVRIQGQRLVGGLTIGMVRSDFEDILGLPASEYISNGKYKIPWLHWLLIDGDRVLVFNYDVEYNISEAEKARSRSGMALMREERGSGWRVPPQYSGTVEDNFITRAFNGANISKLVGGIIESEIRKQLA